MIEQNVFKNLFDGTELGKTALVKKEKKVFIILKLSSALALYL